jgi:hypothetical protein
MKTSLVLLVLILAGCAAGPNQFKGTATEHNVVAGFWLGLWQGFLCPHPNISLYETHPQKQT